MNCALNTQAFYGMQANSNFKIKENIKIRVDNIYFFFIY